MFDFWTRAIVEQGIPREQMVIPTTAGMVCIQQIQRRERDAVGSRCGIQRIESLE